MLLLDSSLQDQISALFHSSDIGHFQKFFNSVKETSSPACFEARMVDESGRYHVFSIRLFKYEKSDSLFFVARDINDSVIKMQRFEKIEKVTQVGAREIDLESDQLFWSEWCHKIHGTDSTTYKPKLEDGISFYHPDSVPRLQEVVSNLMKNGIGYDEEMKIFNLKKQLRWVRIIGGAEFAGEHVIRVFGTIEDITDKKSASNETLKFSETFRGIVENIPLMISFFNKEGEFSWVNPAWIETLGWTLEAMKGKDMFLECYPDPVVRQQAINFMMNPNGSWKVFDTKTKYGSTIRTSWTNVRLSDGRSIGIGKNIEYKKILECQILEKNESIKSLKERLELANKAMKAGVWNWNLRDNKLVWDEAMYSIYQISPEDFEGNFESFSKLLLPEDALRIQKEVNEGTAKRQQEFILEFRIRTKSQEIRTIKGNSVCLYNDQGEVERMVGNNWDVTAEKEMQMKMYHSSQMASLGVMAGGVAHEINNPLSIIKTKSDLLRIQLVQGKFDSEKLQEGLEKISMTVDRIAKIVKSLRTFSRDSEKDSYEPVELSNLIADATDLCFEKFKNNNVQLLVESSLQIQVSWRIIQIGQVILNLLNNSFDAVGGTENPWVRVQYKALSDDRVEISVTDSGLGIPDSIVKQMMNPFFTTKEIGHGTGLGLSISTGFVNSHGGRLYYDNNSKNTRFVMELPISA